MNINAKVDDLNLEEISFEEFSDYCQMRACDGQWSFLDAISCCKLIEEINKIEVKMFFGLIVNKKKTKEAREKAWKELNLKSIR